MNYYEIICDILEELEGYVLDGDKIDSEHTEKLYENVQDTIRWVKDLIG